MLRHHGRKQPEASESVQTRRQKSWSRSPAKFQPAYRRATVTSTWASVPCLPCPMDERKTPRSVFQQCSKRAVVTHYRDSTYPFGRNADLGLHACRFRHHAIQVLVRIVPIRRQRYRDLASESSPNPQTALDVHVRPRQYDRLDAATNPKRQPALPSS